MPGLGHEMAALGGKKQFSLGPKIEGFIREALPDFAHLTVLMYLVRQAKGGCSAGEVAKFIGDPKKVTQKVLDRFERLEMVRVAGGILGKKYAYERNGPRALLVDRLLKLWEHPQAHDLVLRKILEPKG